MNLIRDFPNAVANYGHVPDLVEIFISRSPCARSLVFTTADGTVYPQGCGRKLLTLVSANPNVNVWKVLYDEVFSGARGGPPDVTALADAELMIALLNRHARVEALLCADYLARG